MARFGTATTVCETQTPRRSSGGFGKSPPLQTPTTVRLSIQLLHNDQPTASLAVWTYVVPSEAMPCSTLSSSAAKAGSGSASALTAPCPRARAIITSLVTSPYRTKNQAEPLPSSLIFRPQQAVIIFTRAIEASRSHETTNSSKFPWFAVTAPQQSCGASDFFQSTRTSSKTFYDRSHLRAQRSWNPATCSVPPLVRSFECLSHQYCAMTAATRRRTPALPTTFICSSRAL